VISGQLQHGGMGWIFLSSNFQFFPRFFGIGCFVSARLLVGFLLVLGKLGVRGKTFCSTEMQISTNFIFEFLVFGELPSFTMWLISDIYNYV
jgi:hypothetical protein